MRITVVWVYIRYIIGPIMPIDWIYFTAMAADKD